MAGEGRDGRAIEPWTARPIPGDAIALVRPALAVVVDEVMATVQAEHPVYADVLDGPEGMGIRLGIEQAFSSFLDAVERGDRPAAETGEVWRRLGEAEFQSGRSLEALRAAWRSGTRAAWRGAASIASLAAVPTPDVISLAEAIFVYADELANDVVEGYLRIQSDEAGERERRRRRVASLLLDSDEHDPEALARAAELARWQIPQSLAALALASETPAAVTRRLDTDALAGGDPDGAWLLIPDPSGPGQAAALRRAVGTTIAALGPTVAPRDAPRSLRWARQTLSLVQRGALPSEHPTQTLHHLGTVVVLQDEQLAATLVAERLAPLDALPKAERDRLLETLHAWLDHLRHTPTIARALHVHPQTVRYRIGRLRELLGDGIDTPDGRFELQLALRARRGL